MTKCANDDCEELITESAKHGIKWCSKVVCKLVRKHLIAMRSKQKNKANSGPRTVADKRKELTMGSTVTNASSSSVKEIISVAMVHTSASQRLSTQRIQVPEETVNLASIVMWSKRKNKNLL